MNIEQIAIANYRVLQNATLKGIQPFSVFLGANGSGKTTFIDAIGFLHDCLATNTRQALEKRGGFAEVISRGATRPEIAISLQYREGISTPLITYRLVIGQENNSPIVARETLAENGQNGPLMDFQKGAGEAIGGETASGVTYQIDDRSSLALKTIGQLSAHPRVASWRRFIEGWFLCDFVPERSRQLGGVGAMEHLSPEGDNIANVVQYLTEKHPDVLEKIIQRLTYRVPQLERVASQPMIDGRLALLCKDKPFSKPFLARFASDGTLKLLAYLILLYDPNPPQLLGIEEPENGLHHRLLAPLMEEFAAYGMRSQVLISTQSPFLVNNIADAKQLWIFQREDNGYTRVTRADRIPDAEHFISSNAGLGDLWSEGYLTGLPY